MKKRLTTVGNVVVLQNSDPISDETKEVEGKIRQRAFEISQVRGHSGREVDDWLAAESEIISVPPAELVEKDGAFVLRLAIGGVAAGDLKVWTASDQMLVKADYRHDHDLDNGTIHLCDFKSATVFRTIRFPHPIDSTTLKTEFQDGILRVTAQRQGAAPPLPPKRASRPAATTRSRTKKAG